MDGFPSACEDSLMLLVFSFGKARGWLVLGVDQIVMADGLFGAGKSRDKIYLTGSMVYIYVYIYIYLQLGYLFMHFM